MGSSIGVRRNNDDAIFINNTLIHTEAVLKFSAQTRFCFIKYIKDKEWAERFYSLEEPTSFTPSTWNRFGYKSPHCSGTRSTEPKSPKNEGIKEQIYTTRSCSFCSTEDLATRDDLRSILIAALMHMYVNELQVPKSVEPPSAANTVIEEFDSSVMLPDCNKSTNRLIRWLSDVSDMFTADELDEYLGDEKQSWISDYKNALINLPVRVIVCTVDVAEQRSPIIYCNDPADCLITKTLDLHELYSEDCSPGGANQVRNAIFNGKKYKRSLTTSDGQCRLRAMKPVFDSTGQHIYTLGVESTLFDDPMLQSGQGVVSENPFNQVEDMLMVLPMLLSAPPISQ